MGSVGEDPIRRAILAKQLRFVRLERFPSLSLATMRTAGEIHGDVSQPPFPTDCSPFSLGFLYSVRSWPRPQFTYFTRNDDPPRRTTRRMLQVAWPISASNVSFSEKQLVMNPASWLRAVYCFLADEDGPTSVEYAVMLAFILVACLAAVNQLATATNDSFQQSGDAIEGAFGG